MSDNSNNGKELDYKFDGIGLTTKEIRQAKKLFEDYKKQYHIDTLSDLQLLGEIVFRETLQIRYKEQAEKSLEQNKKSNDNKPHIIPKNIREALDENLEQILILKEKLGLFSENKADDPFQYIQILKNKFKKWKDENQGSRTLICPWCSKMIMLKIKMDAWDALKHPYFKDRILANEHLWKLYKEGKITKGDIAKILGCAIDYIDSLEERIYKNSFK